MPSAQTNSSLPWFNSTSNCQFTLSFVKGISLCNINTSPCCRLFIQNYFILSYPLCGSDSFHNYRSTPFTLRLFQLTGSNLFVCSILQSLFTQWVGQKKPNRSNFIFHISQVRVIGSSKFLCLSPIIRGLL